MVIHYLLASLVLLSLLSFLIFRGDVIHPAFVTPATFTISALWCAYGMTFWRADIGWSTYGVIVGGLSVFIFVCWAAMNEKAAVRYGGEAGRRPGKLTPIPTGGALFPLYGLLSVLFTVLYFHSVMGIAEANGAGGTWVDKMNAFRGAMLSLGESIPRYISWPFQFFIMSGYASVYIVIHNYAATKKLDIKLTLLSVFLMFASLLQGGRIDMVKLVLFAVVISYFLWRRQAGWRRTAPFGLLFRYAAAGAALFALFVSVRWLVGRTSTAAPLLDLASYFGAPIKLLDLYLAEPAPHTGLWGRETFSGVYWFFGLIFGKPAWLLTYPEFREAGGYGLGNAYGVFRYYIHDFGVGGALVMTALSAAILTWAYKLCKRLTKKERPGRGDVMILSLYAFCSYAIFLQFYGHGVFSNLLHPGEIKRMLFLCVHLAVLLRAERRGAGAGRQSKYIISGGRGERAWAKG